MWGDDERDIQTREKALKEDIVLATFRLVSDRAQYTLTISTSHGTHGVI